jgi:hypothetical protein
MKTKPVSKRVKLDRTVKQYILDCIDSENYDIKVNTDKEKLQFLFNTFQSEYKWQIERVGQYKAFTEWLMGLPSAFNVEFQNYDILQLAIKWESLPKDYTEKQADKILENWFNFITVKTFQLFRKHKIN